MRRRLAAAALAIAAVLAGAAPAHAGGHGDLVLLFGRTMNRLCSIQTGGTLPQQVPLVNVGPRLAKLGGTAAGNVVEDRVPAKAGYCAPNQDREYATWAQITNLRNKYGWTFQSAGVHTEATEESDAQLRQDACGSAADLEARGFPQTQYGYPNGAANARTQKIVASCYPLGRPYSNPGIKFTTPAAAAKSDGLAFTYSVNGGQLAYTSLAKLTQSMEPPAGQVAETQAYMLVVGDYTSPDGSQWWHCSSGEPHATYRIEVYCAADYFAAVRAAAAAGVRIVDLPTAAEELGR